MRLNNWSIAASYDTARSSRLRLRLLHREQVDHLAPAPHRLVLRQHAPLLGIDPAFQAARHGRYVGCPHAVLLFGRNPLIDHCPVSSDSSLHLLTSASGTFRI